MMTNFNPKLSSKGIILVAIPLLVQVIAAWYLTNLLAGAERQGEYVEQSRQIMSETLHLATELYDAEMAMYGYLDYVNQYETPSPEYAQEYERKAQILVRHVKELRALASGHKQESEIVEHCAASTLDVLRMLNKMKNRLNRGDLNAVFALGTLMAYSQKGLQAVDIELKKLVEIEKADSILYDQVVAKRKLARELIYYFLAVNVVFVVILLHYFNTGTISRLGVLMDNTRRLSRQEKLNPVLSGRDEIADLDRVFHEMADAMEAAKERERELLELKKQIMAMVSHDLRAPLTSLQMTLELLMKNNYGDLNTTGQERVASSESSVRRLIRMINDLLDLEKLEAGKMELTLRDIPLAVIAERSIEAVEGLACSRAIKIECEETELEVRGDGDRLIQVLVNILSNAIKFSPDEGTVEVSFTSLASEAEIRVVDRGPGIPEEMRKQIFERYRQLEGQARGGTGLGLAICKLIVEMHKGSIGVDAADGGGSAFWFRIPLATD